jgi:hypothetical protein
LSTTLIGALLLFAICLLPAPLPGGGVLWDSLGGLGFAALALMLPLAWEAESPASGARLELHKQLAIAATLLASVHALGYLLTDPISLEYLKPTAPAHMLAGIIALLGLTALTVTALPEQRRRLFRRFSHFRRVHLYLSLAVLAATLWHVLGTAFTASGPLRMTLLTALLLLTPALAYLARRQGRTVRLSRAPADALEARRQSVYASGFTLLLSALFVAARNG